jgi:hypothetical protein
MAGAVAQVPPWRGSSAQQAWGSEFKFQYCKSVILAIWEAEIKRIAVGG